LAVTLFAAGLSALVNCGSSAGTAAEMPITNDYAQEHELIGAVETDNAAAQAVLSVRNDSAMLSTLSPNDLNTRLSKLLRWIIRSYADSRDLRLLPAVPDGKNAAGLSNFHLQALQKTFWLQDNSLYGAAAIAEYLPPLGRILGESWRRHWAEVFGSLCPDTESDVVVGRLPGYDTGDVNSDIRCNFPRPGPWEMFPMQQFPRPDGPNFDGQTKPIIGTDYPDAKAVPINRGSARALLKYGCLRQVLLGNRTLALEMFDLALQEWDGTGFASSRNHSDHLDGSRGVYSTRDLAFALLCANALGQGNTQYFGSQSRVSKAVIEARLWAAQSDSGGVWTNYCESPSCSTNIVPPFAKLTNEIAPLVLLAYGRAIWTPPTNP
jgi:hypothetical protein